MIDTQKLTTQKDLGNGLIRVSNQELLSRYPEQFDELDRLILDPNGFTETLTPDAIAAAHEESRRYWEACDAAEQARRAVTLKNLPKIVVDSATERER